MSILCSDKAGCAYVLIHTTHENFSFQTGGAHVRTQIIKDSRHPVNIIAKHVLKCRIDKGSGNGVNTAGYIVHGQDGNELAYLIGTSTNEGTTPNTHLDQ
jgi:hypothetical protein